MPYMLHTVGAEPETGTAYPTKQDALANRANGQTVTLAVTEDERQTWQAREQGRFASGQYVAVPWPSRLETRTWIPGRFGLGPVENCKDWITGDEVIEVLIDHTAHYAHVSLKDPGMIAYTPTDAHGLEDRQVRVRPGKYLQEFFSAHLTPEQIRDYASQVKAYTDGIKIATTADDIARVYCAPHGPTSCMGWDDYHSRPHFSHDEAPVRVYGSSDLACAYLGDISGDDVNADTISARCIVWPAKRLHSRIYGDVNTLAHVLQGAGYTSGSMAGARVRVIDAMTGSGDYAMPYIDGIDSADLRGDWFVLGRGDYPTSNTDGSTGIVEEHYYCSADGCDNERDEDDQYCQSCEEDRQTCAQCGEDHFDYSSGETINDDWYCTYCIRNHSTDCEACGDRVCEFEFTRTERRARNMDLCTECKDKVQCDHCSDYVDETDDDDHCASCADTLATERRKSRLTPARPRGQVLRQHRVGVDATDTPTIVVRNCDGEIKTVSVVRHVGPFAIHPALDSSAFTVTHRATGLAASTFDDFDKAVDLAERIKGFDWSFSSLPDMPVVTRQNTIAAIAAVRGSAR